MENMETKIKVGTPEVRCYVCNVTITHNDVDYTGNVELYRYYGGLEESDMEYSEFVDDDGNELEDSLIDRSLLFSECSKMC